MYPFGYVPDEQAVFLGLKSYRNRGHGIFFHLSRNLGVDGALVADNTNGFGLDESDDLEIRNTVIVGKSPLFISQGLSSWCYGPTNSNKVGIQLQPLTNKGKNGAIMKNLTFSGFTNTGCSGSSTALSLEARPDVRLQIGVTPQSQYTF
jgi:hypothetical protein